jgi:putative peptidoglycan lipid II flippase
MVRRFFSFIEREIRGLHEAAYLLAGFALLSQILALMRDRTFAHYFGAGEVLDIYFAAFRIPDLIFAFLTLFVSSFALVPLFARQTKEERGEALGSLLIVFGISAICITGVIALLLPFLLPFLVPGFSAHALAETRTLSYIMLLQPVLLGFSSIVSALIQASRRFMLFALAPIFYNLGIIVGVTLRWIQ